MDEGKGCLAISCTWKEVLSHTSLCMGVNYERRFSNLIDFFSYELRKEVEGV